LDFSEDDIAEIIVWATSTITSGSGFEKYGCKVDKTFTGGSHQLCETLRKSEVLAVLDSLPYPAQDWMYFAYGAEKQPHRLICPISSLVREVRDKCDNGCKFNRLQKLAKLSIEDYSARVLGQTPADTDIFIMEMGINRELWVKEQLGRKLLKYYDILSRYDERGREKVRKILKFD